VNSDHPSEGSSSSEDVDDNLVPDPNAGNPRTAEQKGEIMLNMLDEAIARRGPPPGSNPFSSLDAFVESIPADATWRVHTGQKYVMNHLTDEAKAWVKDRTGIDENTDHTLVRLWGFPEGKFPSQISEKDFPEDNEILPAFETFISPAADGSGDTMVWTTNSFRRADDSSSNKRYTDSLKGEGAKNRPKISDNTFWALNAAGAGGKVKQMASVEVENVDTWNLIKEAKADPNVGNGATEFTMTPNHQPYWNKLVASSAGGPRFYMMADYQASGLVSNLVPKSAEIFASTYDGEWDLQFVLWTFGPP
jgi:hypothetical protein